MPTVYENGSPFDTTDKLADDLQEAFEDILKEFSERTGVYTDIKARLTIATDEYHLDFRRTPNP